MSNENQNKLGKTLWNIADELRGAMNADDFRDYMLSFLFLKYLSSNYETAIKKELGSDYKEDISLNIIEIEVLKKNAKDSKDTELKYKVITPLQAWYDENQDDVKEIEKIMRRKIHYVIQPEYIWSAIVERARIQNKDLLSTLSEAFAHIEDDSFENSFKGLFSEINLNSEKLGKTYEDKNKKLCRIITKINEGISQFSTSVDTLGDAYEYLIGQFAAGGGKKAGEFYTPQEISTILSKIAILDCQDPTMGKKKKLEKVFDFTCGSGSLLLNVKNQLGKDGVIGKIYGQERNITTYNLARMNMLLHGVKDSEFEIHHGDTLSNDWDILSEENPSKKVVFDAIVANPPFSLRWTPSDTMAQDFRFKGYGLAPKSAADFAFLLHGFHFLAKEGTMAIILPHGVLFRGGAEANIRTKLLKDNNIDTIIGLPSNLFFSTGIPVCIIVLKKCRMNDDILFINASGEENFEKKKRQNSLRKRDIEKIVSTYQYRKEEDRYSRRVTMDEIKGHDYNLNISRYITTAKPEKPVNLDEVNNELVEIEKDIKKYTQEHNKFLKELGLKPI